MYSIDISSWMNTYYLLPYTTHIVLYNTFVYIGTIYDWILLIFEWINNVQYDKDLLYCSIKK